MPTMTTEEAIVHLRADPATRDLIIKTYLDEDVPAAAARFTESEEWRETLRWIAHASGQVAGGVVIDVGAGTGIVSYAFAKAGAARVWALEPDPSAVVGQGALRQLTPGLPIEIVGAYGEGLPFRDASVDVVYARQVLHHTHDLDRVLREAARVLRSGGVFMACREHVVDDADQLAQFLAAHPVHQLAGGEHAYSLDRYRSAIIGAGLTLVRQLAPYDSVITAYPMRTQAQVENLVRDNLAQRLGAIGAAIAGIGLVDRLVRGLIEVRRAYPGRMYAFVAQKAI